MSQKHYKREINRAVQNNCARHQVLLLTFQLAEISSFFDPPNFNNSSKLFTVPKSPAIDAFHVVGDINGHTDRVRNPVLVRGVLPDDLRQVKVQVAWHDAKHRLHFCLVLAADYDSLHGGGVLIVDILVEYVQHVDVHVEDDLDVEVLGERWDVLSKLVIGFN